MYKWRLTSPLRRLGLHRRITFPLSQAGSQFGCLEVSSSRALLSFNSLSPVVKFSTTTAGEPFPSNDQPAEFKTAATDESSGSLNGIQSFTSFLKDEEGRVYRFATVLITKSPRKRWSTAVLDGYTRACSLLGQGRAPTLAVAFAYPKHPEIWEALRTIAASLPPQASGSPSPASSSSNGKASAPFIPVIGCLKASWQSDFDRLLRTSGNSLRKQINVRKNHRSSSRTFSGDIYSFSNGFGIPGARIAQFPAPLSQEDHERDEEKEHEGHGKLSQLSIESFIDPKALGEELIVYDTETEENVGNGWESLSSSGHHDKDVNWSLEDDDDGAASLEEIRDILDELAEYQGENISIPRERDVDSDDDYPEPWERSDDSDDSHDRVLSTSADMEGRPLSLPLDKEEHGTTSAMTGARSMNGETTSGHGRPERRVTGHVGGRRYRRSLEKRDPFVSVELQPIHDSAGSEEERSLDRQQGHGEEGEVEDDEKEEDGVGFYPPASRSYRLMVVLNRQTQSGVKERRRSQGRRRDWQQQVVLKRKEFWGLRRRLERAKRARWLRQGGRVGGVPASPNCAWRLPQHVRRDTLGMSAAEFEEFKGSWAGLAGSDWGSLETGYLSKMGKGFSEEDWRRDAKLFPGQVVLCVADMPGARATAFHAVDASVPSLPDLESAVLENNPHMLVLSLPGFDFPAFARRMESIFPKGARAGVSYPDPDPKQSTPKEMQYFRTEAGPLMCSGNEYTSGAVGLAISSDGTGGPISQRVFAELVRMSLGNAEFFGEHHIDECLHPDLFPQSSPPIFPSPATPLAEESAHSTSTAAPSPLPLLFYDKPVFPGIALDLILKGPHYRWLASAASTARQPVGLVSVMNRAGGVTPGKHMIGISADVAPPRSTAEGTDAVLRCLRRFRVAEERVVRRQPHSFGLCMAGEVEFFDDAPCPSEAALEQLRGAANEAVQTLESIAEKAIQSPRRSRDWPKKLRDLDPASTSFILAHLICENLPISMEAKVRWLTMTDTSARLMEVNYLLTEWEKLLPKTAR